MFRCFIPNLISSVIYTFIKKCLNKYEFEGVLSASSVWNKGVCTSYSIYVKVFVWIGEMWFDECFS